MIEKWRLHDQPSYLGGSEAVQKIRARMDDGTLTTWFESDRGRFMAVVTNRRRAMVVLLHEPGDPGEHAIDPDAQGEQGGYVLENGQDDTYANCDTVALHVALALVEHVADHGRPPEDVAWESDR